MTILGVFTPDNLLAGDFPRVADGVTILAGRSLTRGAVLGRVTASGKCKAVDSGQTDGSQTIHAVLAEDVDASLADASGVVYLTGEFNENALTFGGTDTPDTHRDAARLKSIFFRKAVSA
jgi:hypothetical protein